METIIRRGIAWSELEALQQGLVERVKQNPASAFLLVSEPQSTFTYGRSASSQDLLWSDASARGVHVQRVDRGGRWTYHGPGQVVLYPILCLPYWGYSKRAVRRYLMDLAVSVRLFLQSFGLEPAIQEDPFGIYISEGKLVSFGLCLRGGISSHGLALYLTPQSPYFEGIVPCGRSDVRCSSLHEAGISVAWDAVASSLVEYVKRGFQASKN